MEYSLCHECGTKKNLGTRQESNLWLPVPRGPGALTTTQLQQRFVHVLEFFGHKYAVAD